MSDNTSRLRLKFWEQLLEKSKNRKLRLFESISPIKYAQLGSKPISKEKVGTSGIMYEYVMSLLPVETRVQLRINVGTKEENKRIYDVFQSQYQEIEKDFSSILCWLRRDNDIYSRISFTVTKNCVKDINQWDDTQNKMVDAMIKLEQALSKHYGKIKKLYM